MDYKNILIVDDSSTSQMIIQRCFFIAGYCEAKYHYTENGLDALNMLNNNPDIDLIVTDLNMPKMDGANMIKKIKMIDRLKNLPVIVISSLGEGTVESELLKLGILGIIKKPISPQNIIHLIGGAL